MAGLLLVATSCFAGSSAGPGAQPASRQAETSPTPTHVPPQRLEPVPDDQRQRLDLTRATVRDGIEIDLLDATSAPTVDEALVARGMLLVQLSLFSTGPGYDAIRPDR